MAHGRFASLDHGDAAMKLLWCTVLAALAAPALAATGSSASFSGLRNTTTYTQDAWAMPWTDAPRGWRGLDGPETSVASLRLQSPFIEGAAPGLQISAQSGAAAPADFQHLAGDVPVRLRKDLEHRAALWGQWGVQVGGNLPHVPEPSTWALLLAGLGVVGFVIWQRRD
jgi:hypothetical protein